MPGFARVTLVLALAATLHSSAARLTQPDGQPEIKPETSRLDAVIYSTRGDESVHILAADDLRHLASIPVGAGLHELAIDSSGRYLMGSAYGGPGPGHQPADNRLVVVDLAARKVHRTITLEGLKRPNDIAFIPGTTEAFVTAEMPQHVLRVNAETGEYAKHPLQHNAGHMLALAPDAKTVYVSHVKPGNLSVVDAASGEVKQTLTLPDGAEGLAIAPDGSTLWVASHQASRISVISTGTHEITRSIICPGMPFRMKFSPDGSTVAVSCPGVGAVAFIDVADPAKIEFVDTTTFKGEPLDLQHVPTSLAFSSDGSRVFAVCNGDEGWIIAIDVKTRMVIARVKSVGAVADAMLAGDGLEG